MTLTVPMRPEISVHPAANHDPTWRDDRTGRTDDGRSHDRSPAAGGDAPRAQTTALASIVLRAMRLAASNTGMIRCFMTALLGLLFYGPVSSASCGDFVHAT
ncbi:MAG: hypothetical protein DMG97_30150 [Acidobacteria bacterium]|nr:MAG: hypothetical protein DMG97_30150 [Acidobacteriota bacterium]